MPSKKICWLVAWVCLVTFFPSILIGQTVQSTGQESADPPKDSGWRDYAVVATIIALGSALIYYVSRDSGEQEKPPASLPGDDTEVRKAGETTKHTETQHSRPSQPVLQDEERKANENKSAKVIPPPKPVSKLFPWVIRFLEVHTAQRVASMTEIKAGEQFLNTFSVSSFCSALASDTEAKRIAEVLVCMNEGDLKRQVRAFLEEPAGRIFERLFATSVSFPATDNLDFDIWFVQHLQARVASTGGELSTETSPRTLLQFLENMTYDVPGSHVPETTHGRTINSFLFRNYDFLHSDKWTEFIAGLRMAE